jgi:hypothetical protein
MVTIIRWLGEEIIKKFVHFFKPDWRRILFFLLTMGGLNYYWIFGNNVLDARMLFGLPLPFYPKGSFFLDFLEPGESIPVVEFSRVNFTIDIIFWYLFACVIFSLIDYLKTKITKDNN